RDERGFFHQFIQVFNVKLMWKNRMLVMVWLIFIAYLTGFHMYFTHIMNYFIYTRGYSEGTAGLIFGIGLIAAIPTTLLAARFLNRFKFTETASVTIATNILGIVLLGLTSWIPEAAPVWKFACILVSVAVVGAGYMCTTQALSVWAKNLYPDAQRGQLEGLRTFVCICIPMVVGPVLANLIITNWGAPVVIDG
ncbi:MAG: MFS transporter, partial [Clostridia bacterium]|nr:MFS transporter [Clostridia bacterium]